MMKQTDVWIMSCTTYTAKNDFLTFCKTRVLLLHVFQDIFSCLTPRIFFLGSITAKFSEIRSYPQFKKPIFGSIQSMLMWNRCLFDLIWRVHDNHTLHVHVQCIHCSCCDIWDYWAVNLCTVGDDEDKTSSFFILCIPFVFLSLNMYSVLTWRFFSLICEFKWNWRSEQFFSLWSF